MEKLKNTVAEQQDDQLEHDVVVETLMNMFGEVMTLDAITAIVESCNHDLDRSVEAIISINTVFNAAEPKLKLLKNNPDDLIQNCVLNETIKSIGNPSNSISTQPNAAYLTELYTDSCAVVPSIQNIDTVDQSVETIINKNGAFNATELKSQLLQCDPNNLVQNCDSNKSIESIGNQSNLDSTQPRPGYPSLRNIHSPAVFASAQNIDTVKIESTNFDARNTQNTNSNPNNETFSYTGVVKKAGLSKNHSVPPPPLVSNNVIPSNNIFFKWTDEIRNILSYHNQGVRVLIILRGASGSGKSSLAKHLISMTIGSTPNDFKNHIFSTDDYFVRRNNYDFNKSLLSLAHNRNQTNVHKAMEQGLSPIIVDNTNIELWEMEPYARMAVENGYYIEVVEPQTPWAKKPGQLVRKSLHNVPLSNIKRMVDNFQEGITGERLLAQLGLSYRPGMVPPVLRKVPAVETKEELVPPVSATVPFGKLSFERIVATEPSQKADSKKEDSKITDVNLNDNVWTEDKVFTKCEMQENALKTEIKSEELQSTQETNATTSNMLIEPVNDSEDWRKISLFMSHWTDDTEVKTVLPLPTVEKVTSATSVEVGDTDINNPRMIQKVVNATPRDINFMLHRSDKKYKIPEKWMLDKSTMTNEDDFSLNSTTVKCHKHENHFKAFRNMFKHISKSVLRDIYDKCCGDVNWAALIVLDDNNTISNNKKSLVADYDDTSSSESESEGDCDCLSKYNIIPNISEPNIKNEIVEKTLTSEDRAAESPKIQGKLKKDKSVSEMSAKLKKEIEKNINILDEYYSPHTLNIRKMRRGEMVAIPNDSNQNLSTNIDFSSINIPSTSADFVPFTSDSKSDDESIASENSNSSNEKTENISLGADFVSQLDKFFGRKDMIYPQYIEPTVHMPVSVLKILDALWMESLTEQIDSYTNARASMIQEDEEFARQLAAKEAELQKEGKEPEVPDFKEIMDMDIAMSVYRKDVEEWRNNAPNDLAARMTRDKLCNLFPDVSRDTLTELLMAHENNFQTTVEMVLQSTGRGDILEEKNGLNKFVMQKELARKHEILKEKELTEDEWPLLPDGKVDIKTVTEYRDKAAEHLQQRNSNFAKANDYIHRGITEVASYYSDLANFHMRKYEELSSLAALKLVQYHADNTKDNTTLDLHFLRVGEARESLDLFLDTHIQKCREGSHSVGKVKLFLITGRGLHSAGGPRVKPAIKKRLKERGLVYHECNPGLLMIKINSETKLTHQIP